MPYDVKNKEQPSKEKKVGAEFVCAIDPGVSTFMTTVSTDRAVKYNDNFLKGLFKKHDKL